MLMYSCGKHEAPTSGYDPTDLRTCPECSMKTYVFAVMAGAYDEYGLAGIFATAEAAMMEYLKVTWTQTHSRVGERRWQGNDYHPYDNIEYLTEPIEIVEVEVQ